MCSIISGFFGEMKLYEFSSYFDEQIENNEQWCNNLQNLKSSFSGPSCRGYVAGVLSAPLILKIRQYQVASVNIKIGKNQ